MLDLTRSEFNVTSKSVQPQLTSNMSSALRQKTSSSMFCDEFQEFLGNEELEELSFNSNYRDAVDEKSESPFWQVHCSLYGISAATDNKEQNFSKLTSFIKKSTKAGNFSALSKTLTSLLGTSDVSVEQVCHTKNDNWLHNEPAGENIIAADVQGSPRKKALCATGTKETSLNASVTFSNEFLDEIFCFEKCGNETSGRDNPAVETELDHKKSTHKGQESTVRTEFKETISPESQNFPFAVESENLDGINFEISGNDNDENELKLSGSSSSSDLHMYSCPRSYKVLCDSLDSASNKISSGDILSQLKEEMNNSFKIRANDVLPNDDDDDDAKSQLGNEENELRGSKEHDSSILELEASQTSYAELLQQSLNSMSLLEVEEKSLIIENDADRGKCSSGFLAENSVSQFKNGKSEACMGMGKSLLCDKVDLDHSLKPSEENVDAKSPAQNSATFPSLVTKTELGILDTSDQNEHLHIRTGAAHELHKKDLKSLSDGLGTEMQHANFTAGNEHSRIVSSPCLESRHNERASFKVTFENEKKILEDVQKVLNREAATDLFGESSNAHTYQKSEEFNIKHSPVTKFSEASTSAVQESSSLSAAQQTKGLREPIKFPQKDEVIERKAYMEPFVSCDPLENRDNEDPRWDVLRRITCDEDRVRQIRELWMNVVTPDPNVNMTRHARKIFMNACSKRGFKGGRLCASEKKAVLLSLLQPHHETSRKRARDCTADYDVVMPPSKRQKFSAVSDLGFIREKMMECERIVHEDFNELRRRVGPRLPQHKKRRLSNDYEKKVNHIVYGLSEAERLHLFYSGVSRNEETKREWIEMDHLYQAFRKYYKWQGNEFCTINS